ncbi:MAG TPA: hypothetical protein VJ783_05020 [Pirellulales bacterium]|nr:hypothetical protein [Pirellulales bacterium]
MSGANPSLTGERPLRLHAVIVFVATVAVATALAILNLGFVRVSREKYNDFEWQNGWPIVFLSRATGIDATRRDPEAWVPAQTVRWFRPAAAISDVLLALGLAGGAWWAARRRFRSRRPFQYGMRGLLLSVTALSALLGWALHHHHRQQRVIDDSSALHFGFHVDQGLPQALRQFLPGGRFRLFDRIRIVHVIGPNCTGDRFKPLADLHDVTTLEVMSNELDDAAVKHLSGWRRLVFLYAVGPDHVTDTGLKYLSGLTELRELKLGSPEITDAGLIYLARLERLERLDLSNTGISDAGLAHLRGLRALKSLFLVNTQVSDAGLNDLIDLPNLEILALGGTQITDAGLMRLSTLRHLTLVDVRNTRVTKEGIARFKRARPGCRVAQ